MASAKDVDNSFSTVSLNRRRLIVRCQPRTLYMAWAIFILIFAAAIGSLYQRPALRAKYVTHFKRFTFALGVAERLGISGDPSQDVFLNRKGLNVPSDDTAGRRPVSMPMGPEAIIGYIGESFFRLFRTIDADNDDYLDPVEFKRLMQRIGPIKDFNPPSTVEPFSHPAIAGGEATAEERTIQLHCEFDPLHLDTITKHLSPVRLNEPLH